MFFVRADVREENKLLSFSPLSLGYRLDRFSARSVREMRFFQTRLAISDTRCRFAFSIRQVDVNSHILHFIFIIVSNP